MSTNTVTIDRELFEWLVEYAIELLVEKDYLKRYSEQTRWGKEYKQLRTIAKQAVAIRDGVQKERDE